MRAVDPHGVECGREPLVRAGAVMGGEASEEHVDPLSLEVLQGDDTDGRLARLQPFGTTSMAFSGSDERRAAAPVRGGVR